MLSDVQKGEPLRAADQNALIGEVNGLLRRPGETDWPTLLLVELTSAVTMPDLDTADPNYFNVDPTPYATAQRCLCWTHGGSDAYRSYAADTARELTVWFPTAPRDDEGYANGEAPASSGDRLVVFANPQSGRWEVVGKLTAGAKARWIRFGLTAALAYTDDTATATVLDYWDGDDPDPESKGITVYNIAINTGTNRYLFGGANDGVGLACYDPELDRYRIVQLECP